MFFCRAGFFSTLHICSTSIHLVRPILLLLLCFYVFLQNYGNAIHLSYISTTVVDFSYSQKFYFLLFNIILWYMLLYVECNRDQETLVHIHIETNKIYSFFFEKQWKRTQRKTNKRMKNKTKENTKFVMWKSFRYKRNISHVIILVLSLMFVCGKSW